MSHIGSGVTQGGKPPRELTGWIRDMTDPLDRVTVIVEPALRTPLKDKLIKSGVPEDRIDILDKGEEFKAGGPHLLLIADIENRDCLKVSQRGADNDPATILVVPKEGYASATRNERRGDEPFIMHADMQEDSVEGILMEGVMQVLDRQMPATLPADVQKPYSEEKIDYVKRTREHIRDKKILVCSTIWNYMDVREFYGSFTDREKAISEKDKDTAFKLLSESPQDYAVFVTSDPRLLKKVREDPQFAHICIGFQSFKRYNDYGSLNREATPTGCHFPLPSNLHQDPNYLARFIDEGFELKGKGLDMSRSEAEKSFSWAFGIKS